MPSCASNVFYKNLHKYKNSFDSLKDRLDTKMLSQFSKFQIFITQKLHCICKWLLLCFSRNKSFLKILLSGEYKKFWFLESRDWIFAVRNLIAPEHCVMGQKGDLGFEKCEASFKDLVKTVKT